MRTSSLLRAAPLTPVALFIASLAVAGGPPPVDRSFEAASRAASTPRTLAPELAPRVASVDERTGRPSFVWGMLDRGVPGSAEDAARTHLRAHARALGLPESALDAMVVARTHDTGRGGVIVVLRQELGGVPVLSHDTKVLMRRDHALVAITGTPRADVVDAANRAFTLPPEEAIARALSDLHGGTVSRDALSLRADAKGKAWGRYDLTAPGALSFDDPARARAVFFPDGEVLAPAFQVEVFTRASGHTAAYGYVIDARDGRVLRRRDLTSHAEFVYRVFADPAGDHRPLDGPIQDFTPHPTGQPDGSYPGFVPPVNVSMEGFNKFGDPWLADSATATRGNNVDAYTDHDDTNSVAGDTRAELTSPGAFEHVYDTSLGPTATLEQQMAAVTQLFYTTNWLHDDWYDAGFDEPAGNAQIDNYGRGGEEDDPLRCEAQDAFDLGATNNANMATPSDGASPRMQMFVWSGVGGARSLTVDAIAGELATNVAEFGPEAFSLTAPLVRVDDGVGTTSDGCEPPMNDLTGAIALVDRGTCTFAFKAETVAAAGAVGMILANNQGGAPPFMPGASSSNIPVLSITQADGDALEAALLGGPVSASMSREATVQTDGTIDNLVVAHEWGHYLHHRLVDCGLNQCGGQSEGWGDFVAMMVSIREGDNLAGTWADSIYAPAGYDDPAYFGIRRVPYSTDFTKNPLTFRHIAASEELPTTAPMSPGVPYNPEVHNAGEIWATMMFEVYTSLLGASQGPAPKYTFAEARQRMKDYVVAGMTLAPVEPTYTEQRDAIIAAAYANDPEDAQLVAEGFARRGAGSCAISPPRDSFDNEGVVESYEVAPAVSIVSVNLTDGDESCDGDGVLDRGEVGRLDVVLSNAGYLPAEGTTVSVASTTPGVTFPGGASEKQVAIVDGFGQATVSFDVAVDAISEPSLIELEVTVENAASCNPTVVRVEQPRVSYDTLLEASATDDFESDAELWELDGDASELIWSRKAEGSGNHLWHGVDYSSISDTSLVSPDLVVSADEPLVMTFSHRFKFEASEAEPGNPDSFILWDGGVIEVRKTVGGTGWEDVSEYVDPGYVGTIGDLADNPLADREAYSAESEDYPEMQAVTLDFGDAFAGDTVQFRFRIGTDQAASEIGWEIDDVSFTGLAATPFPVIAPDAQVCSDDEPPVAVAGPAQTVEPGVLVVLDGTGSFDPDGDELTFDWTQTVGADVLEPIEEAGALAFVAPEEAVGTTLRFELLVTANGKSTSDFVEVTVVAKGEELEPTGGCDCSTPRRSDAPLGALALLGLGVAGLRRRARRFRTR